MGIKFLVSWPEICDRKTHAMTREERIHSIVVIVLTIIGLIVSFFPAYWTYLCRFHGESCEMSTVSLSPNTAKANHDIVNRDLASDNIKSIDITKHAGWVSNKVDVIAKYQDGREKSIDVVDMPYFTSFRMIASSSKLSAAVVFRAWEFIDRKWSRRINIAYFSVYPNFLRRDISLDCMANSYNPEPDIHLNNIVIDTDKSRLIGELITNCAKLGVSGRDTFDVSRDEDYFGGTSKGSKISIELDSDHYVKSVLDVKAHEDFMRAYDYTGSCVAQHLRQKHAKSENKVELCSSQYFDRGLLINEFAVVSISNGESKLSESGGCKGGADFRTYTDDDHSYLIIACRGRYWPQGPHTHYNVTILFDVNRKGIAHISCDCSALDIKNASFDHKQKKVYVALHGDSDDIKVNDKTHHLDRDIDLFSYVALTLDQDNDIGSIINIKKVN